MHDAIFFSPAIRHSEFCSHVSRCVSPRLRIFDARFRGRVPSTGRLGKAAAPRLVAPRESRESRASGSPDQGRRKTSTMELAVAEKRSSPDSARERQQETTGADSTFVQLHHELRHLDDLLISFEALNLKEDTSFAYIYLDI